MSISVTGPVKKRNEYRGNSRLSKVAIDCMREALTEIGQKNGLEHGDLIVQLETIIKDRFPQPEKALCHYFTKNGSPCRRSCMKDSNFCSVHKNNGAKYAALETLFREKFKRENKNACDSLTLKELVLRSASQSQSS